MSAITVRFVRPAGGRLSLEIDATPLHQYLDLLGVPHDGTSYSDQPSGSGNLIDNYSHSIRPAALLRCGVQTVALSQYYSNPISKSAMVSLARSVESAALAVIEHYRPVALRVEVALKAPAATAAPASTDAAQVGGAP